MGKRIKIGLVGVGSFGYSFLQYLLNLDDQFFIEWIVDPNKQVTERILENHNIIGYDCLQEVPAKKLGVNYESAALVEILSQTQSYPYFLQEWGKYSWQCAERSPITLDNVKFATELAIAELDASFFRVRFDRLTRGEKKYLRAMAELGPGSHRSGDIAQLLKKEVQAVAPTRATLIAKGMIYSPAHGDNAFTVPLFNSYMKRVMPDIGA